jgi:hypothetical protein
MRFLVIAACAVLLGACAGRAPAPVAVVQPQDRYMDCAAITAEVQANNKRISELGSEEGGKVAQNVIVGAAGLFIPILWFGMDFQNAAGKEVAALQSRQQYLATLAEQRCGALPPVPIQTIPAAPAAAPSPEPAVTPAAPAASGVPAQSAPPSGASSVECQLPDGSKAVVGGSACPPGWTPIGRSS